MCFSAVASFSASAVLGVVGVVALKQNKDQKMQLFASIPVLFAFQQLSEGFLWLALTNPEFANLKPGMTFIFLLFAQVIWPIWAPLSILLIEKQTGRRKILNYLFGIGIIMGFFLATQIILYPVDAYIMNCHIFYELELPVGKTWWSGALYLIPALMPFFISSYRGIRIIGATIFLGYMVTKIFYMEYLISVWCFFAAIISITIIFFIRQISVIDDGDLMFSKKTIN